MNNKADQITKVKELVARSVSDEKKCVLYETLIELYENQVSELQRLSRIDPVTGLLNRKGFDELFNKFLKSSQRRNEPLALLFIDSDSLKQINDNQGHDAGDQFIKNISDVLKNIVRSSDFISRWGGDEFAVLLENTDRIQAYSLAQRIRQSIETLTKGTVSIGLYSSIPTSEESALKSADKALYQAKERGKNCIVMCG